MNETVPSINPIPPRSSERQSRISVKALTLLLLGIVFILFSFWLMYKYIEENRPNMERISLQFDGMDKPLFYQGKMMDLPAIGSGEGLKLPFSVVKSIIDPHLAYEKETDSVIITTHSKVVRMKTEQLTAWMNEEPFELRFPIEMVDGIIYLPIEPLRQFYEIDIAESADTGAVILRKNGDVLQWGRLLDTVEETRQPVYVRANATVKAPIVTELSGGARVMLWGEKDGWYEVQLENGLRGYADKTKIVLDSVERVEMPVKEKPYVPWKPLGGKINLTWEYAHPHSKRPDTSVIGDIPGVNVVSPTWFYLIDGSGAMKSYANAEYVEWAHARGYQIWALVSNATNPDWTTEALSTYDHRMRMIKQLLSWAELYRIQGINIDFENVYLKDKANFVQFMRELTPLAHEQGLAISVDVTIRGGSAMWSLFLDRRELGKIVDYMIVMTYDEHWGASPKAGSVASLPWVEKGIVDIMRDDQVPASKLVLGVPFYTRLWTEEEKDGKAVVSSQALTMGAQNNIIKEKSLQPVYLEDVKQNYVEYSEDGKLKKIWMEDETSMRARIELVKKYDLAGAASWRRGYETPAIWTLIKEVLESRP
jgi:spore germination protein YaaH